MTKYFAKLDSKVENLYLKNGNIPLQGYKVIDIKVGHNEDNISSIKSFHNNDAEYVEYFMDEENNLKERPAFVGGYYLPSLDKFTDLRLFNSFVLNNTNFNFVTPLPWPDIDNDFVLLHTNNEWLVSWDNTNLQVQRWKKDENEKVIEPKVIQVYNVETNTWNN
jgi:hypothetical protein